MTKLKECILAAKYDSLSIRKAKEIGVSDSEDMYAVFNEAGQVEFCGEINDLHNFFYPKNMCQ